MQTVFGSCRLSPSSAWSRLFGSSFWSYRYPSCSSFSRPVGRNCSHAWATQNNFSCSWQRSWVTRLC